MLTSVFLLVVSIILIALTILCGFSALAAFGMGFENPIFIFVGLLLLVLVIPLGTAGGYLYMMALDAQSDAIWERQGSRPILH